MKPLDQVLANTPALLLGVDLPALKKEFQVSPLATSDGLEWFELLPRNEESVFRQVLIGFRGEMLERMELFDHLGQSTQLQFSGVEVRITSYNVCYTKLLRSTPLNCSWVDCPR